MSIPRSLLLTATLLSLTLTAPAELPAEARIEHLEQAARHLAEVGMEDQAADLRAEADDIRRDLREGQIDELGAMIERLRREHQALQERLAHLETQSNAAAPRVGETAHPDPDLDQLAAEAHRKQTAETWAAIKRAAQGKRPPAPDAAPDPPTPLLPPQERVPEQDTPDPPSLPGPIPTPSEQPSQLGPDDRALLQQILQTLQRIEQQMGQ